MHELYMQRCLQLARLGKGAAAPNPMVGCVVVHDGLIIGEGYHHQYGAPHAEVNAINAVKNPQLLQNSQLYVSLEPCSHFGKTPPCSDLIIEKKIPEVFIGCVDTFSEVSGKGIEKLEKAGVKVNVGILQDEARELNKRFFTFHEKKRPFVILKWAQTLDGFIAPIDHSESKIISNAYSQALIHKWRTEEVAIMVGKNTVESDNPKLTARLWKGSNPTRIVIDKNLSLNPTFNIFNSEASTIVFNNIESFENQNIIKTQIDFSQDIIPQILDRLYEMEIQSILVEGGSITLNSFFNSGLWDEARVFYSSRMMKNGISAPQSKGKLISEEKIDTDILRVFKNL